MKRIEGIAAARRFVDTYCPDSLGALLCGSVARGEATSRSDLDILIVSDQEINFCRKSFRDYGWVIEAFIGSPTFNTEKIQPPHTNHGASYLTSWAEGIILKDHNSFSENLKQRAMVILEQGPPALTQQEIDRYRYVITDWLDNLIEPKSEEEALFTGYELVAKAAELLLAHDRQWIAEGRWLYRALEKSENRKARRLIEALDGFHRRREKKALVTVIESILEVVGGKLYEGYSDVR